MMMKIVQALRDLHREEEGFTLIELLIVIAIIAIIAAIAIPTVANRIDAARESADRANVKLLQGLVDLYYIDFGYYPLAETVTGDVTISGDWIKELQDEGYLLDPVTSPYPGVTPGYTLKVEGAGGPRPTGKVESTETNRWKTSLTS